MTIERTKEALIAFGSETVSYSGSALAGLKVVLTSGDHLSVSPAQLQSLSEIAAQHNPLLDPPQPGVVAWMSAHGLAVFGRTLDSEDARRVIGVLGGEGFLPWGSGGHVDHFPAMSIEQALAACIGRVCFYGERQLCAPVRLNRASVDDRYIEIELTVQELADGGQSALVDGRNLLVGVKRSAASSGNGALFASYYVNWILVTEPGKVRRLIDYFLEHAGTRALLDEVRRAARD